MDEEKILFKCILNDSVEDFIEHNKIIYSKRYLVFQIILSLILIIAFLSFSFSEMNEYYVSFKFAALKYFTNAVRLFINIVIIIVILKIAYVESWIRGIFMRKNLCIGYSHVCFYESQCIFFNEADSKVYSKLNVPYSSIDKSIVIDNSMLLDSQKLRFSVFKDSFEIGDFDDFVEFIQGKVRRRAFL